MSAFKRLCLVSWKRAARWLDQQQLGRDFRLFFIAAFFFDAGFAVYFFLFNLFLLDQHWNEQQMGWVGGALTAGSLLATLPVGMLTRRYGVRRMLGICFTAAPMLGILRAAWVWLPAAICTAFLMGMAMSIWAVCMLPTVAATTRESGRARAFSFIFCVSVATSAIGGLVCSLLPHWLAKMGLALPPVEVKRMLLFASSLLALVGLLPVLRLPALDAAVVGDPEIEAGGSAIVLFQKKRPLNPFLIRYLPAMALWSGFLAAFTPYGNVYLTRELHLPLQRVAVVFSLVQVVQFGMGLLLPTVLRMFGTSNGIALIQAGAAVLLAVMSGVHRTWLALALYLAFAAAQWMCSPALYSLLMNRTAEKGRGTASAMTMFCSALAGTACTVAAGSLFTHLGYPVTMLGIAAFAFSVAVLFRTVVTRGGDDNVGHDRPGAATAFLGEEGSLT